MGKDSVGNIPFVEYNRHRQKKTHIKKKKNYIQWKTKQQKKYRETDTLYCSTKEVPEKLSLSCRFDYQ